MSKAADRNRSVGFSFNIRRKNRNRTKTNNIRLPEIYKKTIHRNQNREVLKAVPVLLCHQQSYTAFGQYPRERPSETRPPPPPSKQPPAANV